MEFFLTITLGEILGIFFGSVSALIDVIGFVSHYRSLNLLKSIKSSLESQAIVLRSNLQKNDHQLLELLTRSQIIFPHVKGKLFNRFFVTLVLILFGSILVASDTPGELLSRYEGFETLDIPIILLQIALALLNFTKTAFEDREKVFLANVSAVQAVFYDEFVVPAIDEFNDMAPKLELVRKARRVQSSQQKNLEKQIRKIVSDEINRNRD